MASSWVLKVPRSDEKQGYILLQLSHKSTQADLDLTLFASEGEAPYTTKIKQKRIKDLRSSKYAGSDEEWAAILRHVLIPKQQPSGLAEELRKSVEVTASVSGSEPTRAIIISLRNRIDQITQKLGSLELRETDDEIQLFDWAGSAVDQRTALEEEVALLRTKAAGDQDTIRALQLQLEDLVRAKNDHEEQLISKFALLLNEKKLMIRNQQRILGTAKHDKEKLARLRLSLGGTRKQTTTSASRKRRAETDLSVNASEDEESDGFETMDVDHMPNAVGADARSSRETTSETETASEDEGSLGQHATSTLAAESQTSKQSAQMTSASPPQPRTLPFTKKPAQGPAVASKPKLPEAPLDSDEETASDDDEL